MASLRQMLRNRRNREEVYSRPNTGTARPRNTRVTPSRCGRTIISTGSTTASSSPCRHTKLPNVRGLDILDLGCGTGRIARHLAQRGARFTGVDFADKAVAIAARCPLGKNLRYEVGSMFELRVRPSTM